MPAIKRAGPFSTVSRADGLILVHPSWPQGVDGVFGRMDLADEIEQVLNAVHERFAAEKKRNGRASLLRS